MNIEVFRCLEMDYLIPQGKIDKNICKGLLELIKQQIVARNEAPDASDAKPDSFQVADNCLGFRCDEANCSQAGLVAFAIPYDGSYRIGPKIRQTI